MPAELRFSCSDSGQSPAERAVTGLRLARWCASNGWPVHPLAPGRKTPPANCRACSEKSHTYTNCSCLQAGRWCHGFHAATLDYSRIEQWWTSNPSLGVGVACGPAGLVVIDIDVHESPTPQRDRLLPGIPVGDGVDLRGLRTGFHSLAVLAALRGESSPADDESTLRVRTPSGGMHVWYRATDGRRWQSSTGAGKRALAWQVDVRAHGGYIIAPGTSTPAGTYEPLGDVHQPAPLPAWLAHELQRTGHLPAPHIPASRPVPPRARQAVLAAGGGQNKASRLLASLLAEVTACAQVAEGAGFTEKLNRAAYTFGGLVAAGHFTESAAQEALREAADSARPGQDQRSSQIIRSGMTAGARHPLHLGGPR
ncbi:bifunctional DNA primase/polymerase [Streptomyces sp. H27-S2]|uniref:bifunctional DNA primase/polymerase n=1 Tax=Streptomyces antarcticus TaxID=2996458 RepID=UPI00226EE8AC|nr:bifunctional DNA primase/polymerase [Streptomyces sp. H27-S2]MCY0951527.1 bifunctional DNA primase/polymerase [Streptomyces sp. H27-S2]